MSFASRHCIFEFCLFYGQLWDPSHVAGGVAAAITDIAADLVPLQFQKFLKRPILHDKMKEACTLEFNRTTLLERGGGGKPR